MLHCIHLSLDYIYIDLFPHYFTLGQKYLCGEPNANKRLDSARFSIPKYEQTEIAKLFSIRIINDGLGG